MTFLNLLSADTQDCPSHKLRKHAYALELLAQVAESSIIADNPKLEPCLRQEAEDALNAGAQILEQNLSGSHLLAQISKQVHLNEFKMKKGFRQYYQTTVFGYLRQKRIERASHLLTENKSTVIEVAQTVGYSNPSHFSRAFRNTFGLNPKDFVAHRRTDIDGFQP